MVRSDIRLCGTWRATHDQPVYTLGTSCPACGADTVNPMPARFSPEDRYGEYRRALKRRRRE